MSTEGANNKGMNMETKQADQPSATHCYVDCGRGQQVKLDAEIKDKLDRNGIKVRTRSNGYGKQYAYVRLAGVKVPLARYVFGDSEEPFICHKNDNPLDCTRENLMGVMSKVGGVRANGSRTGPAWGAGKGYYWDESGLRYRTLITVNGKKYYGKSADTKEEASSNAARLAMKLYLDGVISKRMCDRWLVGPS